MNYLIYDCETIRPVLDPKRDHFVHPGVEYADSWTDYVKMGIAVICAYESATDRYRVFFQDNFDEFKTLTGRVDLCIGYNNRRFDNPLLEANIGLRFDQHDCPVSYDLLAAIWESLGSSFVRGCSLDSMSRANGLPGKTCTGALAPVLWQQGNRGTVVDNCLHDVWLVKRLMEKVFTDG